MNLWFAFVTGFKQVWVDYFTPLAWLLAWGYYWLGDLICRVLELNDNSEGWCAFWYQPYNWCMTKSSNSQNWAQGESRWWPWQPTQPSENEL